MISPLSIASVREAAQSDIAKLIGEYVPLKKAGANYTGLCPFHSEKSPSFNVSPSRGIFKCFGCGQGGDAIKFITEFTKKSFYDTIEELAKKYNITLEYEGEKQTEEEKSHLEKCYACIELAWKIFTKAYDESDAAKDYIENRKIRIKSKGAGPGENSLRHFQYGYANLSWKLITSPLIEAGFFPEATELGLIKTKDGRSYDNFINRIIIPIHDASGRLCAFAGRVITKEDEKQYAKWKNSNTVVGIYEKKSILYNLHRAAPAIRKAKKAYLAEGYFDVISPFEFGIENIVASCNKDVTAEQVTLLKRFCNHVVLIGDNDSKKIVEERPAEENQENPGRDGMRRNQSRFIRAGFKTEVVELKDCKDADELARLFSQEFTPVEDKPAPVEPVAVAAPVENEDGKIIVGTQEKLVGW